MIEQFITKLKIDKVDFKSIRYILDVGSRDGLQSIELKGHFTNAKVLAIEGNADMMPTLRKNVLAHSDIKPIEAVINDYVGESIFYRIDKEKPITPHLDGNPGASSLFIADESYQLEKYHQIPVPVKCYTLDYICDEEGVDSVDLIWMDLQGAEIKALSGFLNRLPHLKYIWVEVTHSTIYKKQPLFQEFNHFMHTNGFERITKINPNTYFEEVLYRRINLKKSTPDDIVISQSWGGG
jgi:FkbM family methyltransferase